MPTGMTAVVWVFFITPHANGIHGEPEITGFPIFDREITLENSPWKNCSCFKWRWRAKRTRAACWPLSLLDFVRRQGLPSPTTSNPSRQRHQVGLPGAHSAPSFGLAIGLVNSLSTPPEALPAFLGDCGWSRRRDLGGGKKRRVEAQTAPLYARNLTLPSTLHCNVSPIAGIATDFGGRTCGGTGGGTERKSCDRNRSFANHGAKTPLCAGDVLHSLHDMAIGAAVILGFPTPASS
jgi:hypothetical protein